MPARRLIRQNTHVLLSDTEGPVNLGFICRAMANTGFYNLRFTGALTGFEEEASIYAVHAADILKNSQKKENFHSLTEDMDVLIGLSPRAPWADGLDISVDELPDIVASACASGRQAGILFGNERTGLTNAELSACTHRLALPTDSEYPSMNLAQAVLVVLWELQRADADIPPTTDAPQACSGKTRAVMLDNLKDFLDEFDYFYKDNDNTRWHEFLIMFNSKNWTDREASLLTSMLNTARRQYKAKKDR